MRAVALKRRQRAAPVPGAVPAPFPGFIAFSHPELRARPPGGSGYLHEVKADGYRAQLSIERGRIKVYSRSGFDWTDDQFNPIAAAAGFLRKRDVIIDGEAVVLNARGAPD